MDIHRKRIYNEFESFRCKKNDVSSDICKMILLHTETVVYFLYKNQKVTAFAGIAYPEKFFNSLSEQGAILENKISYPDHHIFDENDMLNLAENANLTKSVLVTTKKDFVRIPKSYRSLVSTLNGEIKFEDENLLKEILSNVLENKINDLAI